MIPNDQPRVRALQLAGVGILELLSLAAFASFDWKIGAGVFFAMWARNLNRKLCR